MKDIGASMTLEVSESELETTEFIPDDTPLNQDDELIRSQELREILSGDESGRELHQSPNNSPPPSPPREVCEDRDRDSSSQVTKIRGNAASSSTLGTVSAVTQQYSTSSSTQQQPPPAKKKVMVLKKPPQLQLVSQAASQPDNTGHGAETKTGARTALNNSKQTTTAPLSQENEEDEALKVLELQKTPCMYANSRKRNLNKPPKQFSRDTSAGAKAETTTTTAKSAAKTSTAATPTPTVGDHSITPVPPQGSANTATRIRRKSKEKVLLQNPFIPQSSTSTQSTTHKQSFPPYNNIGHVIKDDDGLTNKVATTTATTKNQPVTVSIPSSTNNTADLSIKVDASDSSTSLHNHTEYPIFNSTIESPPPIILAHHMRQTSTDSSGMEESTNQLKKSKKMGLSKSFSVKGEKGNTHNAETSLSLANHLTKKLCLAVNTSHQQDSDEFSSGGYCASRGSSSGDYEYVEDDSQEHFEEGESSSSSSNKGAVTAPSYHDQKDLEGVKGKKEKKSSKKKSSHSQKTTQHTEKKVVNEDNNSRPIAPFTSEKLYLHNNLGADNFFQAGQGGAAAIRKEAALALNAPSYTKQHKSSSSSSSVKYSHYHATAKSYSNSSKKHKKRSKSANVATTGSSKLVLPSLLGTSSVQRGVNGEPVIVIPQLALRAIQSAPTVTRSLNLPPLTKGSKTPSHKSSKVSSSSKHSTSLFGTSLTESEQEGFGQEGFGEGGAFQQSLRFVSEEAEREGGILAPRKA